nr:AAA family ATPase [Lachnospiraceae bacterium]
MARTVGIGHQDYAKVVMHDNFYVDKTMFIKEWWENDDAVTLITRPRRFGKTLNMSMLQWFFSNNHPNCSELFERFAIWQEEKYQNLQGTYPLLFLTFADVKDRNRDAAIWSMKSNIAALYNENRFLMEEGFLNSVEQAQFESINMDMSDRVAAKSIRVLCDYLSRYYDKKVIILLDEYDTPMQEAYVGGYWDDIVSFMRNLFNATFKTNPFLEKALMTGVTRVSKESIFSDLNNLEVVTATSEKYAEIFGFTQEEVSAALQEFGMSDWERHVKDWYDGFTFGTKTDIYNPWS